MDIQAVEFCTIYFVIGSIFCTQQMTDYMYLSFCLITALDVVFEGVLGEGRCQQVSSYTRPLARGLSRCLLDTLLLILDILISIFSVYNNAMG